MSPDGFLDDSADLEAEMYQLSHHLTEERSILRSFQNLSMSDYSGTHISKTFFSYNSPCNASIYGTCSQDRFLILSWLGKTLKYSSLVILAGSLFFMLRLHKENIKRQGELCVAGMKADLNFSTCTQSARMPVCQHVPLASVLVPDNEQRLH